MIGNEMTYVRVCDGVHEKHIGESGLDFGVTKKADFSGSRAIHEKLATLVHRISQEMGIVGNV